MSRHRNRNRSFSIPKLIILVSFIFGVIHGCNKWNCHRAYKDYDKSNDQVQSEEVEITSDIGLILQGTHKTKNIQVYDKTISIRWEMNDSSWAISEFPINMIRFEFTQINIPEIRFRWAPNGHTKLSGNLQQDLNKYVQYIVLVIKEEVWDASRIERIKPNENT